MKRTLGWVLVSGVLLAACGWFAEEAPPRAGEGRGGRGTKGAKAKGRKAGAAAGLATSDVDGLTQGSAKGPNVLMIVWDTVRADRTSLYGYDKPTTPRTAAWAQANGVRYARAISPGVWTLPSHASLFTALPVRSHGVDADYTRLDATFTTFAEVLYTAGYDTYAFSANPYMMDPMRLFQGFATIEHPWSTKWKDAVQAHITGKLIAEDRSTVLSPGAVKSTDAQNRYLLKEAGPVASDALFAWLDGRQAAERPWFAFVNLMEAHLPRIPSIDARRAVMSDAQIATSYVTPETTEDFHAYMAGARTYTDDELVAISGVYDASLVDLDTATARIFAELERRGLADDTIVVLTSDHGELLGERGLLLHKYAVVNALTRVPLVIAWPGHLTPGVDDAPISTSDALVKVVEMGQLPVPDSVRAALAARPAPLQPGVVTEFNAVAQASLAKLMKQHEGVGLDRFQRTWQALELGPDKLHVGSDGQRELYDVLVDPHELADRAATDPARVAELEGQLKAWMEAVPALDKSKKEGTFGGHMNGEEGSALRTLGYVE